MNLKIFIFVLFTLSLTLALPSSAKALSLQEIQSDGESFWLRTQEEVQYFFAFQNEKKIAVLEKHAEKRMLKAQEYADNNKEAQVQNMLRNYLRIRTKQIDLLSDVEDGEVLGAVADSVIQEQQTMETIKTQLSEDGKIVVMQTQEQVVNQVAQHIVVVNGPEGQTEFFQEVEHVWAPGTGPGGESGVVIEGGEMRWAPGTGPGGGEAGVTYEGGSGTVILQGGGENGNSPGGDSGGSQGGLAPGTTAGGGNNSVETNVIDNVESAPSEGDTWLAP